MAQPWRFILVRDFAKRRAVNDAFQNLWLAARVEGLDVGWVSILDAAELRALFGIPEAVVVIANLYLGRVSEFAAVADLEGGR